MASPPLGRCKVFTDHLLDFTDGAPEGRQVLFRHGRQGAHQHQMAEVGGTGLGKRWQCLKGTDFRRARQALIRVIQHQNETPRIRQGQAGEQGRHHRAGLAPAIHHQAAVFKCADADAGACPPVHQTGNLPHGQVESRQPGQGHTDGQGQLGARPESGVFGDGFMQADSGSNRTLQAGGKLLRQHQAFFTGGPFGFPIVCQAEVKPGV